MIAELGETSVTNMADERKQSNGATPQIFLLRLLLEQSKPV